MTLLLILFGIGAIVVPALAGRLGRRVFLIAGIVPLAAFAAALAALPAVLRDGAVVERIEWVPQLDLALELRLDALSLLLALVVTGVGALVFVYCAGYFRGDQAGLGRFAGILLAFAGSMYGLVIADNVYLLFVFWEATTVFSYLLIGHNRERRSSRNAALQALLVTTLGGLAMLVGLVLVAEAAGTASLSGLLASPPEGDVVLPAMVLVLVGILSKSAIFPFHFWLPGAMAAPTPVSAYLHAAAMVKAGVYLALRLAPAFAEQPGWRETLAVLGLTTMLLGGIRALRQTDLKLLLAHGTVSQLGFLVVLAGWGTASAALAASVLLLAHALFKSTLFLVVGIVDHGCGTRDLRRITGFARRAPVLLATAAVAVVSMAGIPVALGFVAKEEALGALFGEIANGSWIATVVLAGFVAGSALTLAYGLRFLWGAFGDKPGVDPLPDERPHAFSETAALFAPPMILAAVGLVAGPLAGVLDPAVAPIAADLSGEVRHLALWHGLEPALAGSAASLALGAMLAFLVARRIPAADPDVDGIGVRAYRMALRAIDRVALLITSLTQRGSLPFYLGVIYLVGAGSLLVGIVGVTSWPVERDLIQGPAQAPIGIVMVIAAIAATTASKRFPAIVLVGMTGFGIAAIFALHGAPDLAITQVLVELVTVVAVVLVLRRLPARLGARHGSRHRLARAVVGIAVGVSIAVVAVVAAGARTDAPISLAWTELAPKLGHGDNIVNVALVDLRGWDTLGELTVVIAAATGVASLIFLRSRTDDLPRVSRRRASATIRERRRASAESEDTTTRASWLLAGRTLAPHHRSILLEVVVRLMFHSLIVLSVVVLLSGHNAPGGGFAAGLVVGLALVARYLAGGRVELGAAAPFDAGKVLGTGLVLAAGTALLPLFFGVDALTSTWFELELGVFGHLEFVTSTVFDVGVYLVVIGLVLDVLRSLGAEVDRQIEVETGSRVTPR